MHFTAKERFVTTQMGRIHCFDAGSGPALMLVHSNGASAYEYEFVIDMLAKKYRVIAWDMPGQGDSDNPPSGATGAIGDRLWIDVDGDGVQDPGEAGLSSTMAPPVYDPGSFGAAEAASPGSNDA